MARPDDAELAELLKQFVCVHRTRMRDTDLAIFQFDYDLTWWSMFVDANGGAYCRFGGAKDANAEARVSVAALKHTMRRLLEEYRRKPRPLELEPYRPKYPQDLFPAKGQGCMHCHEVWEGMRKQARTEGRFDPRTLYVYPEPELIGLKLDATEGNRVVAVTPHSLAHKADLRAGDLLQALNGAKIVAQGDVLWALHNAPWEGQVPAAVVRDGHVRSLVLDLPAGWKKTDISWRHSMRKEKKGTK